MPARLTGTGRGRISALDDELARRIADRIAAGNYLTTAAQAEGIPTRTVESWTARGRAEAERLEQLNDPNAEPHPREAIYLRFLRLTEDARARRQAELVKVIDGVIHGGAVTKRTPVTDRGKLVRDEKGDVMYAEEVTPPDGKLALEVLARTDPDRWARRQATQVELTGPGGGPVQVEMGVLAEMAARVAEFRQEREEDGVILGEVVETRELPARPEVAGEGADRDGP